MFHLLDDLVSQPDAGSDTAGTGLSCCQNLDKLSAGKCAKGTSIRPSRSGLPVPPSTPTSNTQLIFGAIDPGYLLNSLRFLHPKP